MKKYRFFFAISLAVVGCQDYENDIETLNSQITSLSSQLDGLTDVVSDYALLKDKVNPLETKIESIEAEIKENTDALIELGKMNEADDYVPPEDTAAPSIDLFLKKHHNTAWIMTEGSYTEHTLFYNSEESFIKFYDSLSFCDNSSQSVIVAEDQYELYIETSLVASENSNRVTFKRQDSFFIDGKGEYMVRDTEGKYIDTLYRATQSANALWSLWECN